MAHLEGSTPEKQVPPAQQKSARESKVPARSLLKYYIHDAVDSCRLQLIGQLSEAEVPELTGCWSTAKTTLGTRKLLVDLRELKAVDDSGKQWIISMANEGAALLPETFLRNELAGHSAADAEPANLSCFARLIGFLRGSRSLPSTQAQ
jgi:hypothetical protein